MNRHLAIAGTLVLAGLAAWWALGSGGQAAGSDAADAHAALTPADGRQVTRFVPTPDAGPPSASEPAPVAPPPDVPSDPRWAPLHGRFRDVMAGHVQVVVPDDATPAEAQELQLDAIDVRSTELDDLIVELTELAETSTDVPTKVDALTSLGEVYLELSETVESTPVPDWMRPRRAARMEEDIANRSAVAIDKARMVFGMAQAAGGDALGADAAARIRAGLEAVE
ncbi:MAG: hypothetical protein H6737_31530 [Alphaproteobacteria bacterium]|nr:hypothetical protein [Alphaproteobacteria bacterium]